jgi:hypothetical protein
VILTRFIPAGSRMIANARPAQHVLVAVLFGCTPIPATAQDRPFLFSVTTATDRAARAVRLEYEVGAGERAFQGGTGPGHEQRIAIQAYRGRWTAIARFGLVEHDRAYRSAQSGELLFSIVQPSATGFTLAAGGGVLHEGGGVNVLLARVVGGREGIAWRLHGNLVLQKPFAEDRDAMDLITTAGWARKLTTGVAIGIETLAEDLEAFWDPAEAEGGARILAGPSLHVSPAAARWQLTATAGPVFHPARTNRSSDALRDLPATRRAVGYAVRAGLTYRFR